MITLKVKGLHIEAVPPVYASPEAAGLDLAASVEGYLKAGEAQAWPTGIAVEIPDGYEGQIRGRSSLAAKSYVFAHLGTIDADYRGELKVILINLGIEPFHIRQGDRIGQLVIAPVVRADVQIVSALSVTSRGEGGFGSTGR